MEYREHFTQEYNKGNIYENTQAYKVTMSGTVYHENTPDELVRELERLIVTGTRIRLNYGDVITGESWDEENDIAGHLSRTSGYHDRHWPILVHNARSTGGGIILDNCIIAIEHSNKAEGGSIYKLKITEAKAL